MTVGEWKREPVGVSSGTSRARLLLALALISLVGVKLWLVAGQCRTATTDAVHDARLFVDLAYHLLAGSWLGPYSALTLAKGPFYPLFLAACSLTGVPSYLGQHLLYVGACLALLAAISGLLRRNPVRTAFFAFLLFNPASYAPVMLSFARETVYGSLLMLVVAGALGAALTPPCRPARIAAWAALLGLSLAMLWLTREEAVEVVPALVLAGLCGLWWGWRRRQRWLRVAAAWLVAPALWATAAGLVCLLNSLHYGVWTTNEFRTLAFRSAYGALSRVEPEEWRPLVPVPREVRERVYRASPAFAELRPFLDGPVGRGWARVSAYQLPPGAVGEIAGGYFMWALRDAVELAGHCADGRSAIAYYTRLAAEVDAACAEGRLRCGPPRAAMAPPWRAELWRPVVGAASEVVTRLVGYRGCEPPRSVESRGDRRGWALFARLSGDCVAPLGGDLRSASGTPVQDPLRVGLLRGLWRVYHWTGPLLGGLALLAVALALARRRLGGTLAAALAILGLALLGRLGVVTFATAVALPSILVRYLSPAWHLLPPLVGLALATLLPPDRGAEPVTVAEDRAGER